MFIATLKAGRPLSYLSALKRFFAVNAEKRFVIKELALYQFFVMTNANKSFITLVVDVHDHLWQSKKIRIANFVVKNLLL